MQKRRKEKKIISIEREKVIIENHSYSFFWKCRRKGFKLQVWYAKKTSSFYLFGSVANEFEFILYIQVNKKKKSMRMMMMMMVFFLTLNNWFFLFFQISNNHHPSSSSFIGLWWLLQVFFCEMNEVVVYAIHKLYLYIFMKVVFYCFFSL